MISFCEKEVYVVYEEEIDRRNIYSFYLNSDYKTEIILVKNYSEEFVGIITYERILYSGDNFIQTQKLNTGEDIWNNASKLFAEDKNMIYLPVFDQNNELVYFSYQSVVADEKMAKQIMNEFYENDNLLFIKELYPKIQVVYLYDLNELAYEFYKLLLKRNIPVVVFGGTWDVILNIKTNLIKAPSFQIMKIHAEGTPLMLEEKEITNKYRFLLPNVWEFLYNMNYLEASAKLNIEEANKKHEEFKAYNNIDKVGSEENIIYVVGPCIVSGFLNFKREQLLYFLHQKLEKDNLKYSIKGVAIPEERCNSLIDIMESLSLRKNDFIIFIGQNFQSLCKKFKINDNVDLDLTDLYNSRKKEDTWFMDHPIHTTRIANEAISNELIEKLIKPEVAKMNFSANPICLQKGKVLLSEEELQKLNGFLKDIQKFRFETQEDAIIGSIVMNCNPITLGHLYLIDYASKMVNYLYIFVVQEDRSFFRFEDRYNLVQKAVEQYKNIRVIPSGEFVLSNKTLPAYFTKEYEKERIIDASEDIGIFAQYIAPALNIKIRFAGEEPLDPITKQYNIEMKRTLTDHGIQFIEIPRKEFSGEVISASKVRKLLKNGEFDEIKKIVPEVTYQYLLERYQYTNNV